MSASAQHGSTAFTTSAFAFVPANVRRALGRPTVPLLSTALAASCAHRLSGPVVELTWPGSSALLGAFRAARRANAALTLVIPDAFAVDDPSARLRIVRAVVSLAEEARFDRPLFLVRRLAGQSARTPDDVERFTAAIAAEVEAGFPSIALRPEGPDALDLEALVRVLGPFSLEGVGFELELDGGHAPGPASLDRASVRFAAVRGVPVEEAPPGALLVVDPLEGPIPSEAPCRVSLDAFVVKGLTRALPPESRQELLRALQDDGAAGALTSALDLLAELDDVERARVEALVYAEVKDAIHALGADDVGDDLEVALFASGDPPEHDAEREPDGR